MCPGDGSTLHCEPIIMSTVDQLPPRVSVSVEVAVVSVDSISWCCRRQCAWPQVDRLPPRMSFEVEVVSADSSG